MTYIANPKHYGREEFAADEPKTVTLTQDEISAFSNAVQAQTAAQIAAQQAKPVLDKIKTAFAPPHEAPK